MTVSNLSVARNSGEQNPSGEQNSNVSAAGTSSEPPVSVGGVGNPAPGQGQEKRRLIQLQLVLLLHAYKCRMNDSLSNVGIEQCTIPNCATMKQVLGHMAVCKNGKNCTVPHCLSSSQIISHWKNCVQTDCPVCSPLKQAAGRRLQDRETATAAAQTSQHSAPTDLQRAYAALALHFTAGNSDNSNASSRGIRP